MEHDNGLVATDDGMGRGASWSASRAVSGGVHGCAVFVYCLCAAQGQQTSWWVVTISTFFSKTILMCFVGNTLICGMIDIHIKKEAVSIWYYKRFWNALEIAGLKILRIADILKHTLLNSFAARLVLQHRSFDVISFLNRGIIEEPTGNCYWTSEILFMIIVPWSSQRISSVVCMLLYPRR